MEVKFRKGRYIPYPCMGGCNHHLRLKQDILELKKEEEITLECPTCNLEKKVKGRELQQIVNSSRNLGE